MTYKIKKSLIHIVGIRRVLLAIAVVLVQFLGNVTNAVAEMEQVRAALSHRHDIPGVERLEQIAGGSDELIDALMTLRHSSTPPFVAIRAEAVLLQYAEREDVRAALEQDLMSDEYLGLANLVARNLDQVTDEEARSALARMVFERADVDASFARHARNISLSRHANLKRLAREYAAE
jgi:hypothetical protein